MSAPSTWQNEVATTLCNSDLFSGNGEEMLDWPYQQALLYQVDEVELHEHAGSLMNVESLKNREGGEVEAVGHKLQNSGSQPESELPNVNVKLTNPNAQVRWISVLAATSRTLMIEVS
jgi:hypothetical protein